LFEDKVVLITGGGSGMGREAAHRFASLGAAVVVADLREETARLVASEIGSHAQGIGMDVGIGTSITAGLDRVVDAHGRLDVLVNNAGMLMPGSAVTLAEEEWDRAMAVNLKSVYLVSKAAWALLSDAHGSIVNVASINAFVGMEEHIAYCTAKAGVVMLTQCMALDGARDGIRVNAVCPGWIRTPMTDGYFESLPDPEAARESVADATPLGRMGRPSDIAEAIVYLASGAAEWVTGTALRADGGLLAGTWNGPAEPAS
jgi:NAD(P)-dependent dehydrogenase (short-subunit alcohol dehydrogenase family)